MDNTYLFTLFFTDIFLLCDVESITVFARQNVCRGSIVDNLLLPSNLCLVSNGGGTVLGILAQHLVHHRSLGLGETELLRVTQVGGVDGWLVKLVGVARTVRMFSGQVGVLSLFSLLFGCLARMADNLCVLLSFQRSSLTKDQ